MCGFAGFLGGTPPHGALEEDGDSVLRKMTDRLVHRGPDDSGCWSDADLRIGLGHRRLAIVDLSPAGHQPMQSASGRYMLVFNGEIYNHMELRRQLGSESRAPAWRGHADTETLLACFDAWGIKTAIHNAMGMFAIAVWDRQTSTLTLARDRIGEKPLYYGWQGKAEEAVFLFGSELKALRAHPLFEHTIDRGALSLQLRHNCVPGPYSIYQGIAKLPPACMLTVSLRQREPRVTPYWSAVEKAHMGMATPFRGTPDDAVNALEVLLKDAVARQMMSDVPLGAFLSGGVDSSTIVALMQAQSTRPVKTFSIGFHEEAYNEAQHAKAVARHLGTDHTELYVTAQQAMDVIPALPSMYDEPFADSSQIPTWLVSRLARQHVTVSLSGDAGDELFCGYNRYQMTARLWRALSALPLSLRKAIGVGITGIPAHAWKTIAGMAHRILPRLTRLGNPGDKLHKGAMVLGSSSVDALYLALISHWRDPSSVVDDGFEPPTLLQGNAPVLDGIGMVERMMLMDMLTYLPDDILVKVDRAAMAVSLETRVPFLDHRVVEFALALPQSLKLRGDDSKWVLRQVLYRYVPRELIERPKMGFGIPLGAWLRGPLREWADGLLSPARLRDEGFFNPAPVQRKWREHLSGARNWEHALWNVLMFQSWLEDQRLAHGNIRFKTHRESANEPSPQQQAVASGMARHAHLAGSK